jgi:hypothetical protein
MKSGRGGTGAAEGEAVAGELFAILSQTRVVSSRMTTVARSVADPKTTSRLFLSG